MNLKSFIDYAEVVSAAIAAMGLAMGLEWVALHSLLRLMPQRLSRQASSRTHQSL